MFGYKIRGIEIRVLKRLLFIYVRCIVFYDKICGSNLNVYGRIIEKRE